MYIFSCNIHSKQNISNLITKQNGDKKNKKPFKHFFFIYLDHKIHIVL